jgi:hypothetical protein
MPVGECEKQIPEGNDRKKGKDKNSKKAKAKAEKSKTEARTHGRLKGLVFVFGR